MKAEILFSTRDLIGALRDGVYNLPEGADVAALVAAAEGSAGETLGEAVKQCLMFLVNSRPAGWETLLQNGDRVRVLFQILGG